MRTTVTLDPDVERGLRDEQHRTHRSFKEVLNRAIREGLSRHARTGHSTPFRVDARPMGLRSGLDPGSLNRLADDLEIDDFKEREERRG